MIRSYSLILRVAGRQGLIVAGRLDPLGLAESPFLLHPVQNGTYYEIDLKRPNKKKSIFRPDTIFFLPAFRRNFKIWHGSRPKH